MTKYDCDKIVDVECGCNKNEDCDKNLVVTKLYFKLCVRLYVYDYIKKL